MKIFSIFLIINTLKVRAIQRLGFASLKTYNFSSDPIWANYTVDVRMNPLDDTDYSVTGILETKRVVKPFLIQIIADTTVIGSQWRKKHGSYLNVNLNLCKFMSERISISGGLVTMFLKDLIKRYGNFPTKCPIPVGAYSMSNLTFVGIKLPFSEFFHFTEREGYTFVNFFTKHNGKKIKFASSDFYGGYYGNSE